MARESRPNANDRNSGKRGPKAARLAGGGLRWKLMGLQGRLAPSTQGFEILPVPSNHAVGSGAAAGNRDVRPARLLADRTTCLWDAEFLAVIVR